MFLPRLPVGTSQSLGCDQFGQNSKPGFRGRNVGLICKPPKSGVKTLQTPQTGKFPNPFQPLVRSAHPPPATRHPPPPSAWEKGLLGFARCMATFARSATSKTAAYSCRSFRPSESAAILVDSPFFSTIALFNNQLLPQGFGFLVVF